MSAPNRQAEIASLVPIPWWTGKNRLGALISRARLTLANTEGELVEGVTLYRNWSLHEPRWVKEGCGDWVFSGMDGGAGQAVTLFYFNAPITAEPEGAFAQSLVEEVLSSESYSWPPILSDLRMIVDTAAIRQTGLNIDFKAAVDRGVWRTGQRVPCLVRTRTYVSLLQPPETLCRASVPMPTEIRGDYYGQPIRIPECLHPEVVLESLNSSDAVIYEATPSRAGLRVGNKLVYKPTNFQTWTKHVFNNQVRKEDGYYRRTEQTVTPPSLPAPTYI